MEPSLLAGKLSLSMTVKVMFIPARPAVRVLPFFRGLLSFKDFAGFLNAKEFKTCAP